jgi:UDP-N-acetylmuramoylalanine--D-glutamate ligase
LLIISPGISVYLPFIEKAKALGIPVWGEMELAYRLCPCPVIAITGTNGKTTVTTLVGEIMRKVRPTVVAGNIGVPLTDHVLDLTAQHIVVAEVSSFQLETIVDFKPRISAVLNLSPDHLDRHKTMENYKAMKERIFENQNAGDFAVLNGSDPYCKTMRPPGKVIYFNEMNICTAAYKTLRENALAAAAIARCADVPMEIIANVLENFKGVPHRLEYISETGGVEYYNDSKATNTDAAVKALENFSQPLILIGGGRNENADFNPWVKKFGDKVKRLILIGEAAEQISKTCDENNFFAYEIANSLEEGVLRAKQIATAGSVVLFSPACKSFDMFKNFEERGCEFKKFVKGGKAI